jgi:hypothetical protein
MKSFLREMFWDFYENFLEVFWGVIVMLGVMILGLAISWFVKKLIERLLMLFRFDRWASDVGISHFLARGGVKSTPSKVVGRIVFWLLIIAFFSFGRRWWGRILAATPSPM